ncbi:MAG: peptidylprolyl isomerase [Mariprofundales bacterium]
MFITTTQTHNKKNIKVALIACMAAAFMLVACDTVPPANKVATATAPAQTSEATADTTSDSKEDKVADAEKSKVVGSVGDHNFTEADIDHEFSQMPENFQSMKDNPQMRGNILNNLMTRYALAEKAREQGIDKDDKVKAQISRMQQSILIQELNKQQREQMQPTNADMRAYYQSHKADFATKEQTQVRHILVKDKELATELLERIKKGEVFAELAKQYSIDTGTKARGGELPPFSAGMMVPPFEQAAFALSEKNKLSDLIETRYGVHIIQFIKKLPANSQSFEEAKEQINNVIVQQQFRDWVEQIKTDMKLSITNQAYQLQTPPATSR